MQAELATRFAALIEQGRGEERASVAFLALATLESGTRVGVDAKGGWLAIPADDRAPLLFGPGREHVLAEVLECKREDFDLQLEQAGRALDLPRDVVSTAFPAVELVTAMLRESSTHFIRLALQWLYPSELREARDEIVALETRPGIPSTLKDLARRHVVAP